MKKTVTEKTIYGHRMTLFVDDYITKKIQRHGIYERASLQLLCGILAKMQRPVVLDVGANVGNHSLAFSRLAHHVYSFEPIKNTFLLLKTNVEQNKIGNVTPLNCGLSNKSGQARIFLNKDNVGASSLERPSDEGESEVVDLRCGDDVIRELGIEKVDFMKVDVEGHEVYALQGLSESIKRFQPVVTMEWNEQSSIDRINQSGLLDSLFAGYQIFVLGSNFDVGYWEQKPLGRIRRRLTLLFCKKRARLYTFKRNKVAHNILLVPLSKHDLISSFH